MNKEAVALAADSAATVDLADVPKVYSSVNKIFGLSAHHPLAVMIYGSSAFLEVPWETIIKAYRTQLGARYLPTVDDHAQDFLSFFRTKRTLFSAAQQESYVRSAVGGYLKHVYEEIVKELEDRVNQQGKVSDSEIRTVTRSLVTEHHRWWKAGEISPAFRRTTEKELTARYNRVIRQAISEIFQPLRPTAAVHARLVSLAGCVIRRFASPLTPSILTGVVIAGFGSEEIFPSVRTIRFEGMAAGRAKYQFLQAESTEITFQTSAAIVAFAQHEMVRTFIEGIQPNYRARLDEAVREIATDYPALVIDSLKGIKDSDKAKLRRAFARQGGTLERACRDVLDEFQRTTYVDPVLEIVAALPKPDLAAMAESLVNLTSFRRRMSKDAETVGGPVDVAVISKGDGLIWIKQKHYFSPELNPHFFRRRAMAEQIGRTR